MSAVVVRILLRYGAGLLVAKGVLAPAAGPALAEDPDIQMLLQVGAGLVAGVVCEGWYLLARRLGWAK
ncbi:MULTISPECIES: hypothetical protein [unclassified Ensifer]|uniref:hypothetical protein n=1 Tax=unclassified Ensifer TaxID=2633371 RepID=UPI0008137C3C|nr:MULTISPECIES: hypothetical protein [unclassified Ensifer]OCO98933.1 hypothetical protein BC362_27215 [Ensifer sp. LC14]OCP04468.1 hypothetical protein BBX50_25850 [Ensifer sp. LC11]OCP04747.1 hypothetical protein BC374_25860 [Ensifer sp. LC13]OCP30571.1 hypothetical protein BC364_25875 [Ensifer sp. LC499]